MSPRDRLRINDLRFLAAAGTLGADDWAALSLCVEWTNHDVTHEICILLALGREPDIDPDALIAVLNTQVPLPNPSFQRSATAADYG